MEETIIKKEDETLNEEKCEKANGEPVELIDMVRMKHQEEVPKNTERLRDILAVQFILCILIVLAFAVINIFDKTTTQWYIDEFKKMTNGEPEQIIKDAVSYITDILK